MEQRLGRQGGARVTGDYFLVIARGLFEIAVVLIYAGEQVACLRRPFSFLRLGEQAMRLFFEGGLISLAQVVSGQIIPRLRAPGAARGVVSDGVPEGGIRPFRLAQGEESERFVEHDALVIVAVGVEFRELALQVPKPSQCLFEAIAFPEEPGVFVVSPGPRFFERRREGGADSRRASQRPARGGVLGMPPPQLPKGERGFAVSPRGAERLGAPEQKIGRLQAFREQEKIAPGDLGCAQGTLFLPVYVDERLVDERRLGRFFSFFDQFFERVPGDGVIPGAERGFRQKQECVVLKRGNLIERFL